eukprot:GHVR01174645.1.p1 GENE.GHVR01174645.1~~GHVR01174645.1.p1  ORF type:complete len:204 (-),score=19.81 GHVR01174645.1:660-1271(-)
MGILITITILQCNMSDNEDVVEERSDKTVDKSCLSQSKDNTNMNNTSASGPESGEGEKQQKKQKDASENSKKRARQHTGATDKANEDVTMITENMIKNIEKSIETNLQKNITDMVTEVVKEVIKNLEKKLMTTVVKTMKEDIFIEMGQRITQVEKTLNDIQKSTAKVTTLLCSVFRWQCYLNGNQIDQLAWIRVFIINISTMS